MLVALGLGTFLATVAVTWWVATHLIHRPRLFFVLEPGERIDPVELGLGGLRMAFGQVGVSNLVVLYLSITNKGRRDIVVSDAGKTLSGVRTPGLTPLPRIDLPRMGILGFRTINSDESAFWIPLAKSKAGSGDPQHLHINIHRIRARAEARFKVVGTVWSEPHIVDPADVYFFPGAIPDVDVRVQGLLTKPFLTH